MRTPSLSILAGLALIAGINHGAAQGTAITYQGRLSANNNTVPDGFYDFRFRVFTAATLGSQVGPTLVSSAVVAGGLFTVRLDFGSGVFNGAARWLDLGVKTSGEALYTQLAPRTELTAAPYSVFAGGVPGSGITGTIPTAAIADGSITAVKIADASLGTTDLANGAVTGAKVADGTIGTVDLADGAVTTPKLGADVGLWTKSGVDLIYNSGNIGVGVAPVVPLHVAGIVRSSGAAGGIFQAYNPNNGTAHVDLSWLNDQARIRVGGAGAGALNGLDIQGTSDKSLFRVTQAGAATILESLAVGTNVFIDNFGSSGGAQFSLRNNSGALSASVDADQGDGGAGLALYNAGGFSTVFLDADNAGGGYFRLRDGGNENRAVISGTAFGVTQTMYNSNRLPVLTIDTSVNAGGQIVVRNSTGDDRVLVAGRGTDGGGEIILGNAAGFASVIISGAEADGTDTDEGGQIILRNAGSVQTIQIDGDDPNGGGLITLADQNGATTIEFDANRSGGGRVTTQVLEITGGSDLSENFDIKAVHDELKAGQIVSIDPKNPGQLMVSNKAYDRTVAGVVSGAGGVKPGMLMGQQGTVANGKHPVALTGRVYCWVDADAGGAIEPGDLLTTSATAGHGMKVSDYARAQGAIVGKAMTGLEKGKGLVLVLVSLQ